LAKHINNALHESSKPEVSKLIIVVISSRCLRREEAFVFEYAFLRLRTFV
jgi:hypothetical protein